jgi:hypothetical protein
MDSLSNHIPDQAMIRKPIAGTSSFSQKSEDWSTVSSSLDEKNS